MLEQAATLRAVRAEALQARARPNPTASLEVENLGTGGNSNNPLQTTLSITQPFEIGGKRSARIAAGEAEIAATEARGRKAQVDYAAELAVSYATAEAMQQRLRLAEENVARASEDLRAAQALVQAGKEAQLRVAQAQASLSSATADREGAAADLTEALANLSALAGAPEPFTSVGGSLLDEPGAPTIAGPPDRSTGIVAAQMERDALAARVRVERKKPIPDIGLSGGVRRFNGSSDTGFVIGVSANIPLFDRNRGAIAAAEARRDAAEQRLARATLEADAARRTAVAQVTAAQGRLAAAREGEAAATEAYRLARVGYDAGKTSLLELLVLRRSLSDARALAIDARLARVRALAALARADGHLAFGEL